MISHKNIVIVHEVYLGIGECSLVMELYDLPFTAFLTFYLSRRMEGGDLFSRIVDTGCMEESEAKFIITQILEAVKYLHSIRIAHRDIKVSY